MHSFGCKIKGLDVRKEGVEDGKMTGFEEREQAEVFTIETAGAP